MELQNAHFAATEAVFALPAASPAHDELVGRAAADVLGLLRDAAPTALRTAEPDALSSRPRHLFIPRSGLELLELQANLLFQVGEPSGDRGGQLAFPIFHTDLEIGAGAAEQAFLIRVAVGAATFANAIRKEAKPNDHSFTLQPWLFAKN